MIPAHVPDILIREAVPDDALCLGVLGMQVFLDTYATQGIRRSLAAQALQAFSPEALAGLIVQPGISIIVAESNNHLVGFAQVALATQHELISTPEVAELQRLYIQERFTGRGVGYRLLQAAERQARAGGASFLWATVWVGNERALAFYPRRGYELVGSPSYTFQNETHENRLFAKRLDTHG